ncbi:MAG: type III-B CRISPR module-associated protein Cmr5 [Chloroflexia bacterium]
MQTREQEYALKAFNDVSAMKSLSEDKRDKYGSMAHKLPVLIRTAGLAQALAFVEARGTDEQKELLKQLATATGHTKLAQDSRTLQLGEYMRLTQQVLAALDWYKRFAQSVLDVKPGAATEGTP